MDLVSKKTLAQKGDKAGLLGKEIKATLRWRTAVDLDLHCFYRLKTDTPPVPQKKGFLAKLVGMGGSSAEGHVCFSSRGSKTASPWIFLDEDAGVGDVGGDNEENI